MSGLFITAVMSGFSFIAASFSSVIVISFFTDGASDSEGPLPSAVTGDFGVGMSDEALAPSLVFNALLEACNTERHTRLTLTLAVRGMAGSAGSSNELLPLSFVADCVLEGTFTGEI